MTVHVTARMLAAYDHFVSVGFTENGAGAAVGNFCQESGELLIATMFREHPDYSGGVPDALKSGGIAEWLGERKTAYIAFSGRAETRLGVPRGSLLNDLGTQCDFVVYELQTTPAYEDLYKYLTSGTRSIVNLTADFMQIYERPKAGPTAGLDNRIAHAEAVVRVAKALKTTPSLAPQPQPAPTAPAPQVPAHPVPIPVPPAPVPPAGLPPILSTSAGRIASVTDTLVAMREARVAELVSADQEVAQYDAALAAFAKLTAAPIQPPAAGSTATTTQGTQTVATQAQVKTVLGMINWKTTISGIVAAVAGVAKVVPALQPYSDILNTIMSVAIGAGLMSAKDNNVTGGTVPQTLEATNRASSPSVK